MSGSDDPRQCPPRTDGMSRERPWVEPGFFYAAGLFEERAAVYFVDERFGYGTLEDVSRPPADRASVFRGEPYRRYIKRPLDTLASLLGIILLSPFLATIAILVKLDSAGPVLFRQRRVGENGEEFWFYKFRSMVEDAEQLKQKLMHLNELEGPVFKICDDPRITRIGKFLRRTSLDELPQLLNVLKGEMSLVGPRPPLPAEVEKFEAWQRQKLAAKPGITCLWQISGRNHIGFTEWMRLDVEYIRKQSLGLDVKILARTLPAVFSRKGAY